MNPLTSGTTNASSGILASLGNNSSLITSIQTQLSTNKKILDPAQQGVVTRLNSQVTSFSAAHNNIAKAQNVLNVAATGLKSIASLITQMQELANKANSPTMINDDRTKLNDTFQGLLTQLTNTAETTQIDGSGLLGSSAVSLDIQTGLDASDATQIHAQKADAATLSIDTADISTVGGAAAAIAALKAALSTVSASQSGIAADQVSLSSKDTLNSAISSNLQNTIDSIEKPDAAQLQMDLQNANNQQSMNYYLINQMNQQAQAVLTIFR